MTLVNETPAIHRPHTSGDEPFTTERLIGSRMMIDPTQVGMKLCREKSDLEIPPMSCVLLGVTGSVAAMRTPNMVHALEEAGHEVRVAVTKNATRFFDSDLLKVYSDEDEWKFAMDKWSWDDPVLHIELRSWAEVLVIAPLDAHTLAKISLGLSDNLLTCVFRAWEHPRPIVLAPAMNTHMWENPQTMRHFRILMENHSLYGVTLPRCSLDVALQMFGSAVCPHIHVVSPVTKKLACGDTGMGAMASVQDIAAAVERALAG